MTGYAASKLSPKYTFVVGYIISGLGGFALIFQTHFSGNIYLIALFVLFAKFGASMAHTVCYIATPTLFPTIVCGTAFGICNLTGRFAGMAVPTINQLPGYQPMLIYTSMNLVSIFVALALRTDYE